MADQAVFLGRADEIRRFSDALSGIPVLGRGDEWPAVMVIHGLGGIGKSTLLRHLFGMVSGPGAAVWVDFEEERKNQPQAFGGDLGPGLRTVLDVLMRACVDELDSHGDRKDAEQAFDGYRTAVARLPQMADQVRAALAEAQQTSMLTTEDQAAIEKSIMLLGSLVAGQPLTPVAAAATGAAIGRSVFSHEALWKRLLGRPKVAPFDYDLMTDPMRVLAKIFGEAVAACSELRPLVVFLDTSELVLQLMPWLRMVMRHAGTRTLWVIGMRVEAEASAGGDGEISRFVREIPGEQLRLMALTRFDDETVRRYLETRVPDRSFLQKEISLVADFTRGLPLAVSLVGDLLCRGVPLDDACAVVERPQDSLEPVTPGQVVQALARRFLVHVERQPGDQAKRDLHRILCLAIANGNLTHAPGVLRALWETDEDLFDGVQDLASRHDFVSSGSFRLHDDVRDALRNDLMDPLRRTRIEPHCQRAVDFLASELQRRHALWSSLSSQIVNKEYQALLLNYVWYSFWLLNSQGWQAALTILPILMVLDEAAANALMTQIQWFADRGTPDEEELLAELIELIPYDLSSKLRFSELGNRRFQIRSSSIGLQRMAEITPTPDLLGTDADREATLEVLRIRQSFKESSELHDPKDAIARLLRHADKADHALFEAIAATLMAIAREQAKKATGQASLEVAANAARAANDLARQNPLVLTEIALNLTRKPFSQALNAQADALYERALEIAPSNTTVLGIYAVFLYEVRQDHDRAEEFYKRTLEVDPEDVFCLGSYAAFLTGVRQDYDRAEECYKRSLEIDPNNANTLGNYAHLLFVGGVDSKAEELALRALDLTSSDKEDSLRAECHFYLFMHSAKNRPSSGCALLELLDRGVCTGTWDFSRNLARCAAEQDPRLSLLEAIAEALAAGDPRRIDNSLRAQICQAH